MPTPKTALLALALLTLPLTAQSPASRRPTAPKTAAPAAAPTIPALFLSDIHLDPYHDPAKVKQLDAAPVTGWPAILAEPDSPTQAQDYAALDKKCPVRGIDTPNALWLSSLKAIHRDAATSKFVTISGDLLAHAFDCKYQTIFPAGNHAAYVAFTEKTIRYIISGLRAELPGVPLYIALGNNDSGCGDYKLDATRDDFLAMAAKIVAEALPSDLAQPDRDAILTDFAATGSYSAPLADVPHTRILVLDDLFLSARFTTCNALPSTAPQRAQFAWLTAQLDAARAQNEHVWILGHIPPGIDLYSTAKKMTNVCTGAKPQMFLETEQLAQTLSAYPDVIRLALFGHTHTDEMRLLLPEGPAADLPAPAAGVPLKIVASITPVNGNNPSFTLARIDPATATLVDYTVILASNQTGIATTWAKEYTYSATFHEPAFNPAAVASLIAKFHADPTAASPASQTYIDDYAPKSAIGQMLQFVWPQYVCAMDHNSAAGYTACTCKAGNGK
jgi:sphingomyelin phosphodiesterase acid-like 3